MTDVPGGFAVFQIQHYGVSARCCYETSMFRVERDRRPDGMTLYVFGELEGEDRHMCNMCEVSLTGDQAKALRDRLDECLQGEKRE